MYRILISLIMMMKKTLLFANIAKRATGKIERNSMIARELLQCTYKKMNWLIRIKFYLYNKQIEM
jgi:hypothetical protein